MSAVISECGKYRYVLRREWSPHFVNRMVFVMLNPSTADAETDDPTIRKCIGFAQRNGFSALSVVNLFAFRSTDPDGLKDTSDPVGPENDSHIATETRNPGDAVFVAWGRNARFWPKRVEAVRKILGRRNVVCLGVTNEGHPRHPLMLPYSTNPGPWPSEPETKEKP